MNKIIQKLINCFNKSKKLYRNNAIYRVKTGQEAITHILYYGKHCKELKENPIFKDIINELEVDILDKLSVLDINDEKSRLSQHALLVALNRVKNSIEEKIELKTDYEESEKTIL